MNQTRTKQKKNHFPTKLKKKKHTTHSMANPPSLSGAAILEGTIHD
jgi:hypothetical protein